MLKVVLLFLLVVLHYIYFKCNILNNKRGSCKYLLLWIFFLLQYLFVLHFLHVMFLCHSTFNYNIFMLYMQIVEIDKLLMCLVCNAIYADHYAHHLACFLDQLIYTLV